MQIIVFLNTTFEHFSWNEGCSSTEHSLLKTIKRHLSKNIEVQAHTSSWNLIFDRFNLDTQFSPAKYIAQRNQHITQHVLLATPVRVQLGMRHSQTHFLPFLQLPNAEHIKLFNQYFENDFYLEKIQPDCFLLSSNAPITTTLNKQHWSPELTDFTLQVMTVESHLRKFHTDVQAWCHSQNFAWNGLYLWGQGKTTQLPLINVKADSQSRNHFFMLHQEQEASNKIFIVKHLSVDNQYLTECEYHLSNTKNTSIDFVFTDGYNVNIQSRDQMSWIKRLLS